MQSKTIFSKLAFILLFVFPLVGRAQYQINGNAVQTSCNCWQLTPAVGGQNGSVWNINLFDLSNPFDFNFDVFLGCSDAGADGLAFVLQPLSVNAGSAGGGIGYQNINPSFAVELDTYANPGEPGYDHMAFQTNGVVTHGGPNTLAGPIQISSTSANVEDCAWHTLNVVWNPTTMTFTAYFDGVLRLTYTGDIVNNLFGGNPNVYWGFTAATGGANNQHQFCNSLNPDFTVTSQSQCATFPVEFTSASVVATGLVTNYQWDFGDGGTGTGSPTTHTYATAGTYTVSLTITSEGCTQTSSNQITIYPLPTFSLGTDQSICDGDSYQISPTGLTGGEQLLWNPITGLDNPGVSNPNASPTTTTTYTLGILDLNGCPGTDDIQITVNPLPTANAGPDQSICDGDATTMAASGGVSYAWSPATGLSNAASATSQASPTATTTYTVTVTDGNGCQDTDDMTLTVNPLPTVNAGTDDGVCTGSNIQLGATGAVSYAWSPNTGLSNASIANPVFSGTNTTTFTVTGTDANGCENTDDVQITVYPLPVADFPDPADACLGTPSYFFDNSTGNTLSYAWDFGDNSAMDPAQDPTHTYATAGTFNVGLTVTDANGCQASTTGQASVYTLPSPVMNITDGQEFCEQELIQFMNLTQGNITSILWDFGDNAFLPAFPNHTSTLDDPTFAYPNFAFSPFTVRLSVTDAAGCFNQAQATIIIRDKPVADFSTDVVCEGSATQFTDESQVFGSVVDTWTWDFGDSQGTSSNQNPTYSYSPAGIYTAELMVETDHGCRDTVEHDIIVNPTPVVSISGIDTCLNDETAFTNNSSPQDNTIVSWDWDFGDGAVYNGVNAVHTYANHGTFTITLTATSDSGCVASGTTSVKVFPNPEPAFNLFEAEGCTPHEVLFVNQSTIATGFLDSYEWEFGNGATSTETSPQYTYIDSGYYDITLTAVSTEGCTTTLVAADAVRANITPVASFSIKENVLSLLDASVDLTNNSLHGLTWDWRFGDGWTSNLQNPDHTYDEPGTYQIQLTVTNGDCQDETYGTVKVEPIYTFYIPNAFTPNENDINEGFFGIGESVDIYNMKIFNRWGELLFESNEPDFHWDGKYKGKPVEAGTYVYEFYILDLLGEDHIYTGYFQVMK